jgi:phosphoserine phosphatase
MTEHAIDGLLPSWRDGTAKQSVLAFLRSVTDGPAAIPIADRVAAFDFDGTLACEKPRTVLAEFLADTAGRQGPESVLAASGGGGHDVLRGLGVAFAGRTVAEYDEQARRFLGGAVHPRFGCLYPTLVYQPMLELIRLLCALEFSVFVCTDSSRDFLRVISEQVLGLRREHIIGSEVQIQSQGGQLVRSANPLPFDDGPGKTVHLWDRTGAQPVLAAGNAVGDIAMLAAARYSLVLHHDDPAREYAYDDEQVLTAAAQNAWTILSMRDDFAHLWVANETDGAQ